MSLIYNIQFLRAVAAMAVVFYHLVMHFDYQWSVLSPFFSFFSQVGYAGVDVFFVISGYVMWLTSQKTNRAGEFIYSRLTRIYFGYWPYFFITFALLFYFTPNLIDRIDLMGSFWLTQTKLHLLLLQVAWTLTYELYFYFSFSLLLLLPRRFMPKVVCFLMMFIIVIQGYHIIFNDMYAIEKFPQNSLFLLFFTSPFCLEFLVGCLLGYFFEKHRLNQMWLILLAATVIFAAGYYYQSVYLLPNAMMSQGYYLPQRVLFWGTTSVLVVAILIELNLRGFVIRKQLSKLLGGASYSIYLSHIPIIFLFSQLGYFSDIKTTEKLGFVFFSVIAVILIYSIFHYLVIEKPLMKLAKLVRYKFWPLSE